MAVFGGITQQQQVTGQAVTRLQALRRALQDCQDMNEWPAGLSVTDQGTVPSSYSPPVTINTVYVFGASQRLVAGPS